jgi:hypothetical protein
MAPIKLRANMVVFPSWAILFTRGHLITHRATQNFAASGEVTPPSRTAGSVPMCRSCLQKKRTALRALPVQFERIAGTHA